VKALEKAGISYSDIKTSFLPPGAPLSRRALSTPG